MTDTMVCVLKLLVVKEIQQSDTEAVLLFADGSRGRLPRTHKDFDYFRELAEESRDRKYPVGVSLVKPDRILDLACADNDIPMKVTEEDQERVKVLFQGHDGVFRLRRDHPEFKRIRALLEQSIKDEARVWFVADNELFLMDVIKDETK